MMVLLVESVSDHTQVVVTDALVFLSASRRTSECCGALEHYDKAFDRITTRSEKPLKSIKRIFHTVTTTDDPVIRKVKLIPQVSDCVILMVMVNQYL